MTLAKTREAVRDAANWLWRVDAESENPFALYTGLLATLADWLADLGDKLIAQRRVARTSNHTILR